MKKWIGNRKWQEKTLINKKKDTDDSGVEGVKDSAIKLYKEKTTKVIEHIQEIGLPKNNEQIRIITKRSFNTAGFVKFIAEAEKIKTLYLVVYSINYEAAKMIVEQINNGNVGELHLLISNLRNKAHRKKEQITKDMFIAHPKISLFFASSHAKIMTCETLKGNFYTVEGSGNLSYNSRIEQYVIDNDKVIFDFTKKWQAEIKEHLKGKKELVEY